MDKVMKAEIENILEEVSLVGNGNWKKDCQKKATSSITALIIKWLEGKKTKYDSIKDYPNERYVDGRNQLITELIGELR